MKKTTIAAAGAVLVSGVLLASNATAAPPSANGSGPAAAASSSPSPTPSAPPTAAVPSLLVTGVLDGPSRSRKDGIVLKVRRDTQVRSFTLTYGPGVSSGWHQHPGIVLATVEKGRVVQQVGCRSYQRTVGESFTEVAPHQVTNPSGKRDAVLRITQLVPAGLTVLREVVPAPDC